MPGPRPAKYPPSPRRPALRWFLALLHRSRVQGIEGVVNDLDLVVIGCKQRGQRHAELVDTLTIPSIDQSRGGLVIRQSNGDLLRTQRIEEVAEWETRHRRPVDSARAPGQDFVVVLRFDHCAPVR